MKAIKTKLPQRLIEESLGIIVAFAKEVPEQYIAQLIAKSRQPHVMKFEKHEDTEGRFKDQEAYKAWAEKNNRLIYLLVSGNPSQPDTVDVGGIIWFGERKNDQIDSKYGLTFGIRLYEGYVGKGLSKPFMTATHEDMRKYYPDQSLWLDFVKENIAAKRAYESFGYTTLAENEKRIVMGYSFNG